MRVCKNVVVIRPGVFDKYNECVKSSNVKVHRMQEQMNNVSEEMEILRKNQGKVLEIKTVVTKKRMHLMGSLMNWT